MSLGDSRVRLLLWLLGGAGLVAVACFAVLGGTEPPAIGAFVLADERRGEEIVVSGELVHVGTPVVLWSDPGGFDAYSEELAFPAETGNRKDPPSGRRYGKRRNLAPEIATRVAEEGWSLPLLQSQVSQFVFHYDVCGTSRQCFKVLHDLRGLSVHFLLDVDGTVYQSLDLVERAWHAGTANDRSIGVEIAQMGAYPRKRHRVLETWYDEDAEGAFVVLPQWMETGYLRRKGAKYRVARPERVSGVIHGVEYWQYDFTEAQYAALTRLCAALSRVFPKLELRAPLGPDGTLLRGVLPGETRQEFEGFLGHWHVSSRKRDPGPAFDWERVLEGAKQLLGR